MKSRVRGGYEGKFSHHVEQYDGLRPSLQERSADFQPGGLSLRDQSVVDIGCGTGVLALRALQGSVRDALCGDISMLMTQPAKRRQTPKPGAMRFSQLDAEDLPFADDSFDATLSGMTFGLLPDQRRAVKEMVRVIRPGGLVCIGAHGPEHYWVAIDANLHRSNKRYIMGYRLEWWPRDERYLRRLQSMPELEQA